MAGCASGIGLLAILALLASCQGLEYRLSGNVLPVFYNLSISVQGTADNPGSKFDGDAKITLQAKQINVGQIILHKDGIDITNCKLYDTAGALVEEIATSRLTHVQETQQLTVPLTKVLTANVNYTLHFVYTGEIRTDTAGLFKNSYVEEQTGKTKWVLVTEMQAISARLVFPCFDEPAMKAKFQLHIGRPSGFNSISNTKRISTTDEGFNRFTDHFDITPIMSTYLVAFVISEYTARGDINELAIYTRPEYYKLTEFSYSVAQKVPAAYTNLFGQSYKDLGNGLFQYATTPRFPYNSMENWGLVIFKDKVVLEEADISDGYSQKEFTIRNMVHENAHMWFGNSVTFKWWSYVWMNEGFARFYEFLIGNELYPEYKLDEQFVVTKLQSVLSTDSLNITQPMTSPESEILTPADIKYKFGRISFAKAACIVKMWRNCMGPENFDAAIKSYLKQYHLGNVEPKDLFAHLKQHWPTNQVVDLDQFFYDYTEQVGYPVVYANITSLDTVIELRQKRFLQHSNDGSDATLRYTFPLLFTTNRNSNFQNMTPAAYFNKTITLTRLNSQEPLQWFILNNRQANYYRVLYDDNLLGKIKTLISVEGHNGVPVENRAAFINDLFAFAYAGMVDYVDVFKFMEYMTKEVDYIPWVAAYEGLATISKRFTPQQLPDFDKYLADMTVAVFPKLGVSSSPSDTVLQVYNRNMQVSWLCKFHHAGCNNNVRQTFDTIKPTADYKETFYCAASRMGAYSTLLSRFNAQTHPNERELLWRAASCTREYRNHYKNQIIAGNMSVTLKTIGLHQLYAQNPDLVSPIFSMILENVVELNQALDSWQLTAQALSDLSDYFTTAEQRNQFSTFIEKNSNLFGDSAQILRTALGTVDTNIAWAEKRLNHLVTYLRSRNGAATLGVTMATALLLLATSIFNMF